MESQRGGASAGALLRKARRAAQNQRISRLGDQVGDEFGREVSAALSTASQGATLAAPFRPVEHAAERVSGTTHGPVFKETGMNYWIDPTKENGTTGVASRYDGLSEATAPLHPYPSPPDNRIITQLTAGNSADTLPSVTLAANASGSTPSASSAVAVQYGSSDEY